MHPTLQHPVLHEQAAVGRPEPDDRPGWYYVTVVDGRRWGLLAGPYRNDHPKALQALPAAKALARQATPWAAWYAFGTCWSPTDLGPGVLNDQLPEGLRPCPPIPTARRS